MIYQEPGVRYGYSITNLIALGNKLLFTARMALMSVASAMTSSCFPSPLD